MQWAMGVAQIGRFTFSRSQFDSQRIMRRDAIGLSHNYFERNFLSIVSFVMEWIVRYYRRVVKDHFLKDLDQRSRSKK